MSDIVLSFVIPVYNVEKYLPMCLDSILFQDTRDVEIICIEDGSTDDSKAILQMYATKYDEVTVLENDGNRGLSFSRNRGLKHAVGKYVHFVDSDDYLSERLLPDLKETLYSSELDIIGFEFYRVPEKEGEVFKMPIHYKEEVAAVVISGVEIARYISSESLNVSASSKIYRREFLEDNHLAFIEGIYYEDRPFALESLMLSKSIKIIHKAYYYYRARENSIMTMTPTLKHLEGLFRGYLYTLGFLKNLVLNKTMSDAAVAYLNKEFLRTIREFVLRNRDLEIQFEDEILQHQWEHLDYHVQLSMTNKDLGCDLKSIIIYGTGLYGRLAFNGIFKSDKQILGFAETGLPSKESYLTHRVKKINDYEAFKDKALVVVATSAIHYDAIIENLNQLGFKHYKTYDELRME